MSVSLPPLLYAFDALEPHMSRQTLMYHYGRHHKGYVSKLNSLIQDTTDENKSALEILISATDQQVFNNAAQAWNHKFFWNCLAPWGGGPADGVIGEMIRAEYGSYGTFRDAFISEGLSRFGSGWAWLVYDGNRIKLSSTENADTPFADRMFPLATVDVWEHAYYLDHQNNREAYLSNVLDNLINWRFAETNLQRCLAGQNFPEGSAVVVTSGRARTGAQV